jgi:hypothetical protein
MGAFAAHCLTRGKRSGFRPSGRHIGSSLGTLGSNPRHREELLAIGTPPATGREQSALGGVKADASWWRARPFELRAGDRVNDVGQIIGERF